MEFTRYEIKYAWEATMRDYELSKDKEPDLAKTVRRHLDAMERVLRHAWDAFEEEDWDQCAREVLDLHDSAAHARSKLLDLHHAQGHGSSVSPPPAHSGEPET
jgi:hypothetical protein